MPDWYPPFCNRQSQWNGSAYGHKQRMARRARPSTMHGVVIGWNLDWRRPKHQRHLYAIQIPGRERDASWMSQHQIRMLKRRLSKLR